MIRFTRRRLWSLSTAIVAVASALGIPSAATAVDREQELVDQVQQILSRDGPYSADLLEPLAGLAHFYEESGDHRFALVAVEQARQVVRVNRGLHTLDQVPWIFDKIRHEEARGNDPEIWELEQDLLRLIRRHAGDLRTVPMLRQMADRQMTTLREYLGGDKTPEVIYGCFYDESPNDHESQCTAGSRQNVVQGMLAEAQRNYADAIAVMLSHELYDSDELRELEMELLRGVELVRSLHRGSGQYAMPMMPAAFGTEYGQPWRARVAPLVELAGWGLEYSAERQRKSEMRRPNLTLTYSRGRQSLRRLHAYEAASSSDPAVRAEAAAEVADWDLLHSYNGLALQGYELTYAALKGEGASDASIDAVFAPAIPVILPSFNPNPLAHDDARPTTGHLDVAFTLTKFGRARDVEVRDAVNGTDAAAERLRHLLASSRFRPRLEDGRFADAVPVAFRYYLHD